MLTTILQTTILAASLSLAACDDSTSIVGTDPDKNIVETAVAAGSFEMLVAAVQAAGLAETLAGDGPFTVFAPTDAAFAALPAGTVEDLLKPENVDTLRAILLYHVVSGEVKAEDVVKSSELETLQGGSVDVTVGTDGVKVDASRVVDTDILATNGVIHVIDAVLLPE